MDTYHAVHWSSPSSINNDRYNHSVSEFLDCVQWVAMGRREKSLKWNISLIERACHCPESCDMKPQCGILQIAQILMLVVHI